MNAFKRSAVAVALAATFSASAMTFIQDADLAQVSGQEGVSIIADLNIHIGSFKYTDDGAAFSFNDISINGMMIATIDVLQAGVFQSAVVGSVMTQSVRSGGAISAASAAALVGAAGTATGYSGQDVVQFAFPGVGGDFGSIAPTITVGSFGPGTSMGGLKVTRLDLQGTKIWVYGHN